MGFWRSFISYDTIVEIGSDIRISFERERGNRLRLNIDAPKNLDIRKYDARGNEIQNQSSQRTRQEKPKLWYTKIQQLAKRGDPDLILCVNSLFIAWELKVGKNVASDLQDYTLKKIHGAGGVAAVVYPQDLHIHLAVIDELLMREVSIGR